MIGLDILAKAATPLITAFVAWAVAKGWVPEGAGADVGAAIVAVLGAAATWYTSRRAAQAMALARTPGVQILVSPTASSALKQLADDPTHPNITRAE